jgi:UDP-N-acetylmuramoyl-tripeptide--D-alanyl-D-alanine ligase
MTIGIVRDALAGVAKVISTNFIKEARVNRISTDSRTASAGDLFVALKGEKFNGHDFIAQAIDQGCRHVICEKYPAGVIQDGVDIFLVEDSLEAYRKLAQHWRRLLNPHVIAVAGSVGKTTTKDMLQAILMSKFENELLSTSGSQNGFIGIPMTMLRLSEQHKIAVIEVGIDAPGAMIKHIDVVRPDIALVTAISEEHLEWLIDLKTIAYEENSILVETARSGGVAVVNLDDPWISPLWGKITESSKIGFTMVSEPAENILCGNLVTKGDEQKLEVRGLGQKKFEVNLPLPGKHNAMNLLGAVAVAIASGVKPSEITQGIKSFRSSGGRSDLKETNNGVKVLCDFYNANPASMRAAFAVAQEFGGGGRVFYCLGDMKELGVQEESLHRQLADDLVRQNQATVYLYGDRMTWLFDEMKKRGYAGTAKHFNRQEDLIVELSKVVKPKDFVVIKGSNSMKMGSIWDALNLKS